MQPRSHPARLLDGVHARPCPGAVHLRDDAIVFATQDGSRRTWSLAAVRSVRRVAAELQVEIAVEGAPVPAVLIAEDPAFEAALDEARARFTMSPGVAVGSRVRRFGVRAWLVLAAIVIPLTWMLYTLLLPHAHVLVSRESEARLGDAVYEALADRWPVVDDAGFRTLADRMVAELRDEAVGCDVRVTLVREDQPNAFAAPGGRIVVFTGLLRLCPTPDALAGVLAHEIAHAEQRHGLKHLLRTLGVVFFASGFVGGGVQEFSNAETVAELSSGLLILKHSREHESEADRISVGKLLRAGRRATGLQEFFRAAERSGAGSGLTWLSTHPSPTDRIAEVDRLAGPADPGAKPWIEADAWRSLCERLLQ